MRVSLVMLAWVVTSCSREASYEIQSPVGLERYTFKTQGGFVVREGSLNGRSWRTVSRLVPFVYQLLLESRQTLRADPRSCPLETFAGAQVHRCVQGEAGRPREQVSFDEQAPVPEGLPVAAFVGEVEVKQPPPAPGQRDAVVIGHTGKLLKWSNQMPAAP